MNLSEIITAEIIALAYGGAGLGVIKSGAPELVNKKCLIPFTAPGELVSARITQDDKNLVYAELISIEQASPERIAAPCPHFMNCGGCDSQHMNLVAQREAKRSMVEQTLLRQAKLSPARGIKLIGENLPGFKYRRRATFHVSLAGEIGFYKRGTGDVVEFKECLIVEDSISRALDKIKPIIKKYAQIIGSFELEQNWDEIFVVLDLRARDSRLIKDFIQPFPNIALRYQKRVFAENLSKSYPAGSFSQVNPAANEILVSEVSLSLKGKDVTEFYAGSGNFSFPLAEAGANVTAIELDGALVNHAQDKIKALNLESNLFFVQSSAERYAQQKKFARSILLDPPRSGAKDVVKHFSSKGTEQIIYVSCNLPTLTRDLRTLVDFGFVLEQVKVLDMFSQTHHVEMVAELGRK